MAGAAAVLLSLVCSVLVTYAVREAEVSLHARGSTGLEDLSITAEDEFNNMDDFDRMDVGGDGHVSRDAWQGGAGAHSMRNASLLEEARTSDGGSAGGHHCCEERGHGKCCRKKQGTNKKWMDCSSAGSGCMRCSVQSKCR
eukprot:CAMPEP_0179305090 /NCGR_PEP_ID=MMETSP0797-20121207/49438_1 /TAXON_ID=47934 /ORGANISM="Dinophysis acuminata, Strain DAEP01" /LENGTH=140 /DNA_ID=CAMNT_0021014715 /DNA_START=48 /DNA_END=470 /DNA_ORIENTATION=-